MKVEVDVPTSSYGLCGRKATFEEECQHPKAQELCERESGRPGLPVPNSLYGLCGRKATSQEECQNLRAWELCERRGERPKLPVPNSLYGPCGRKSPLTKNVKASKLRRLVNIELDVLGSPSLTVFMGRERGSERDRDRQTDRDRLRQTETERRRETHREAEKRSYKSFVSPKRSTNSPFYFLQN